MAGSPAVTLTWLGDTVLRVKTLGVNAVFIPTKTTSLPGGVDSATESKLLIGLARLGLFAEIDPSVIPDTPGSTPLVTAIGATDPQPFVDPPVIKPQPYIVQ